MKWLKQKYHRLACLFIDHDMTMVAHWSPVKITMRFFCSRCSKDLGGVELEYSGPVPPREKMN